MEVEHSRLLKFFKDSRYSSEMAEAPVIKIQKVFENPPNVEAEVPGTQKIRDFDGSDKNNTQDSDVTNTSEIQITGTEFTLSPVITVTKKESSLTKGDMKLQKVTVTEDIAMEESENGGYRISRESHESFTRTHSQASSSTVVTNRRTEKRVIEGDTEGEKSQDKKKSKIPIMRLRQAAEKVKKERKDQRAREQSRRSSIPKLKDAKKAIKRETSLNYEHKVDDEFDKIYEEIVENKQREIDDKILSMQIDDTERIESKFEELMQSYDEDEEKQTFSRVSKIPAMKRRDEDRPSRIGALIDRAKEKNTKTETNLRDGGFKVTSSTIRTKRFSRGNSRDLSREEQTVNVTETIDIKESGDNDVFVKETVKKAPTKPIRNINKTSNSTHKGDTSEKVVKKMVLKGTVTEGTPAKITHVTSREIKSHGGENDNLHEKFDNIIPDNNDGTVTVEEFEDEDGGKRIITTKTTYSHSLVGKSGDPGVTETVIIEELEDGGNLTTTTRTLVGYSEEVDAPVINDTIIQNFTHEISSDGQSVEIVEDTKTGGINKITEETIVRENVKHGIPVKTERFTRGISREMGNIKQTENKETVKKIKTVGAQEFTNSTSTRENIKETLPVKTETTYGINREVTKDKHNVVTENISSTKETKKGVNQQISRETLLKQSINEGASTQTADNIKSEDNKQEMKKETMQIEQIEKEGIRIGIPAFTKVTESYSKGRIHNVEMSRTIEWKPADEIKTKHFSRSVSEKVTKKEHKDTGTVQFEAPVIISKIADTNNNIKPVTQRATSMQEQNPKDPILEKQIKDTVKNIASKISINKVTEYQSQEHVTNVEKNTYSLSNTVDLTIDRELKKSSEIVRPIGFIDSQSELEYDLKQVSREYSTEINKNSTITDTVTKTKETEHSRSTVQKKNSNTEEVTILKGNVSRLKNKIANENLVVSKKETDDDLPKEKSILSKIAVFESLEPKEAYPMIIRPTGKKTCKYVPKEYIEQKPKIVNELFKEQPKSDSFSDTNNVEISPNYDEVTYVNEPVIVEAIWKSEEGFGQNVSAINRVITEKTTTLETQEDSTNETMNWETAKILPEIIDLRPNESQIETAKTLPAQIQFQDNANQFEVASTLPGKIDFDPHQTTSEEIIEREDKYKIQTSHNPSEYEAKISKSRPGKINLNIWKDQVEANKTLVDKIDVIKGVNIKEITKTLPVKVPLKSQGPVSKVLPEYIDLEKEENHYQIPKSLPGKIDFEIKDIQFEDATALPGDFSYKADDSLNQIGMTLPDQVTLKTQDFTTNEQRAEILTTAPAFEVNINQVEINKTSQDLTVDSNQTDLPKILPVKKDYLKSVRTEIKTIEKAVEVNKSTPGKINLNLWQTQVEVNKTLVGKTSVKKSKEVEIGKSISSKAYYTTHEKQVGHSKHTVQRKIELNKNEKKYETAQTLPVQIDLKTIEHKNDADNKTENQSFNTEDSEVEIIELLPDDSNKTDAAIETISTLPAELDFTTTEYQIEEPKTSPGKIEFETYDTQQSQAAVSETIQSNIYYSATENQTEIVNTLQGKLESKTDYNKVDVVKPLPGKLDLKAWENKVEVNKTLVDKIDEVRSENLDKIVKTMQQPSKIDILTHESNIEDPKTLPGRIDFSTYENNAQITKSSQTQVISEAYQNKVEVATILPGKLEFIIGQNTDDSNTKSNKVEITTEESLSDPELVDEDPDPEPIKFNKESVIGSIKRKMYFITNTNSVQNSLDNLIKTESAEVSNSKELYDDKVEELQTKTYSIANMSQNNLYQTSTLKQVVTTENTSKTKNIYEETTENIEKNNERKVDNTTKNVSTTEYELNHYLNTYQNSMTTSETEVKTTENSTKEYYITNENVKTNENEFNIKTNNVQNELTRSAYGADDFKIDREEMKRAKSLAELDLGDVIHGQVRKMVGRIKSVDFGRRESVKAEKISIKEMPKKMSVLEKIALFEGRASTSRFESTTFRTSTTKSSVTKIITEEEYLQKIGELTTAKARLGTLEEMLYLPLPSGVEMPVIGLGTALTDARLLPHLIGAAIDMGYRAIDTAYIYGNEKEIGQAIQAKIKDGTVKREDLFIMSKLWSTFHRSDLVEEACRASLDKMGLEYFDLYMIHNPMSFKEGPDPIPKIATVLQYSDHDYLNAWFGMETLVTKRLAKSIGVSNFNSQQIQRILDKGRLKPVVNQVECHPYLSQQRLHTFCAERNITLSCYGVLGSKGTPAEYKNSVPPVIDDALVQVMASGLNVSPAQLLIRYQIECGHNVVVKSSSAGHLWDNLQALTFTLEQAQVDALHALNRNKRMFTFKGMGDTHRNYPFSTGY